MTFQNVKKKKTPNQADQYRATIHYILYPMSDSNNCALILYT